MTEEYQDLAGGWADAEAEEISSPPSETGVPLEQVYTRYLSPIYRFLYRRVGNREDAEDLTAETFLKAFRHLDPSRSEASTVHWLYIVARTVAADHWRKYYRYGALVPFDEFHLDATGESPAPDAGETEHRLAEALGPLPDQYRRVLELRFLRGYSVQETARDLGITPGNAKILQHRALARAARHSVAPPPANPSPGSQGRSDEPRHPSTAA